MPWVGSFRNPHISAERNGSQPGGVMIDFKIGITQQGKLRPDYNQIPSISDCLTNLFLDET